MRDLALGLALVLVPLPALAEDAPANQDDEARRARVFATIGGETITVGEIEDGINARSPYARKRFEDPTLIREYADDRVKSMILERGAERLGYENDPEVEAFLDRTILQMFVRQEIEQAESLEAIDDERVTAFYDEHPEEFRRPEMRRASHILVGSRQEAKDIIAELERGTDKTFAGIAKQQSLDTETKLRGGDLLYFTKEGRPVGSTNETVVDAALVKAAFGLEKKGDVTKRPVAVGEGKWSVVQLTAIRPARVQTLDDARSGIRRRLWREERKAALEKLVSDLRAELQPEVYPERLDAIVIDAPRGPIDPPNQ